MLPTSDSTLNTVVDMPKPPPRSQAEDSRVLSCWPLPGNWSGWRESLHQILNLVPESNGDRGLFIGALIENGLFGSTTTASSQSRYLTAMGLLDHGNWHGNVVLSSAGRRYLRDSDASAVQDVLRENIRFVNEIEQLLSERPRPIGQLGKALREMYRAPWKTDWQIRFRLNWMLAFEMIEHLPPALSSGRYPDYRIIQQQRQVQTGRSTRAVAHR